MGSLVEVIPEIDFVYVLKSCQIVQFLFNIVLGHFSGLNNFFHCGQGVEDFTTFRRGQI